MAGRILLSFIVLSLLELFLLIEVGSVIGALWTILLIIGTSIIGVQLVRFQGLGVMNRVREHQRHGEMPAVPMLEGMALLIAGFCLILPGLLTDTVGFLLLVPPLRRWAARGLLARVVIMQPAGNRRDHAGKSHSTVIEGDYKRGDDD